jgi:hypothetical protein
MTERERRSLAFAAEPDSFAQPKQMCTSSVGIADLSLMTFGTSTRNQRSGENLRADQVQDPSFAASTWEDDVWSMVAKLIPPKLATKAQEVLEATCSCLIQEQSE